MSATIPPLVAPLVSQRAKDTLDQVVTFIRNEVHPVEEKILQQEHSEMDFRKWQVHSEIEDLKAKAKAKGLWNLFLPKYYSETAGFTNLEYGLMAFEMGKSFFAPEVFNCAAPDTGNMEVLARYGNDEQKQKWLVPLLEGKIRSGFAMTEKGVSSSDATNIRLAMKIEGDQVVLNGTKWWTSGAGDPRCKLLLVMSKTVDESGNSISENPYLQQSVVIVPADHPGVEIVRPLTVYGYTDQPHGHMEINFHNVRVPLSNLITMQGAGFAIIQGRLGPGRIHHCMRTLGSAEVALSKMIERATDETRKPFGRLLKDHGVVNTWIAQSRIEIDYGKLLVLAAAHKMDVAGPKNAQVDIAKAKIECPNICLRVTDRAVQVYGAEGVSQDQPLAKIWAGNRTLRIADGPDEVHLFQLGRKTVSEYKKSKL